MQLPKFNPLKVQTKARPDATLGVKIDKTQYVVNQKNTTTGLYLAHYLISILSPVVAACVPPEGVSAENYKPDMGLLVLAFAQGMEKMSPAQFVEFAQFMLETVDIEVGQNKVGAVGLFETHFIDKLDHLAVLMANVTVHSGAIRFFSGLGTILNTLSPVAKSLQTSPQDSTGS